MNKKQLQALIELKSKIGYDAYHHGRRGYREGTIGFKTTSYLWDCYNVLSELVKEYEK